MLPHLWQRSVQVSTACILVTIFAVPRTLLAQAHLVSPADLQKEMVTATLARQHNLEAVRQFFVFANGREDSQICGHGFGRSENRCLNAE